jgi:hypothetical protein
MRFLKSSLFKIIGELFLFSIFMLALFYPPNEITFSEWNIQDKNSDPTKIFWTKFQWRNASIGKKYFSKYAMFIPCKIEGIPFNLAFQFDLGAHFTCIYEHCF